MSFADMREGESTRHWVARYMHHYGFKGLDHNGKFFNVGDIIQYQDYTGEYITGEVIDVSLINIGSYRYMLRYETHHDMVMNRYAFSVDINELTKI